MINWLFEYRGTGPILAALFVILSSILPCLPNSQASTRAQYCPPQEEKTERPKDGEYAGIILFLEEKREAAEQKAYASENPCGGGIVCRSLLPKLRAFISKTLDDPIAAFTLVLTLSTLGLWGSTHRLWKAGERQIESARRMERIAGQQVSIQDTQTNILIAQKEIARKSFIVAYRPRLQVRHVFIETARVGGPAFFFSHGNDVKGSVVVVNVGGSSATIVDSHYRIYFSKTGLPMVSPLDAREHELIVTGTVLQIGESCAVALKNQIVMEGANPNALRLFEQEGWTLYVMGQIRYADEFGYERFMGFCRKWDGKSKFGAVDEPDYEYAD